MNESQKHNIDGDSKPKRVDPLVSQLSDLARTPWVKAALADQVRRAYLAEDISNQKDETLNLRNKGIYDDMVREFMNVWRYKVKEGKPKDLDYRDEFIIGERTAHKDFTVEIRKDYGLFILDYVHDELGEQRVVFTSARDLWNKVDVLWQER